MSKFLLRAALVLVVVAPLAVNPGCASQHCQYYPHHRKVCPPGYTA